MYGYIHMILKDFVQTIAGEDMWPRVLEECGGCWEEEEVLRPVLLDDDMTFSLVAASQRLLKLSSEECLHAWGQHFALYALRSGNWSFLKAQGSTLPAFMSNINNLHQQMERDHPKARFPFMEVEYEQGASEALLTYVSARSGWSPVVVGALEEIGRRLYGVDVSFEQVAAPEELRAAESRQRAAAWRVSWQPRPGGPEPFQSLPKAKQLPFPILHGLMAEMKKLQCCTTHFLEEEELSSTAVSIAAQRKAMEIEQMGEEEARYSLMRGARAQTIAASWSDRTLVHCRPFWSSASGRPEDYDLSEDVSSADAFISHSWSQPEDWDRIMGSDVVYADFKSTTLATMAKDVALSQGEVDRWGEVVFWVDKCCIPQDVPALKSRCIQLIEDFMSRCQRICVIFTWTYLERLWCVFEWASFLVEKEPTSIFLEVEFFVKVETLPLYLGAVRRFSLANAKCSNESDRAILRGKIARCYVSSEAFEELVKVTAIALMARSMAYCGGRSQRLRRMFFQPWVEIAEELHYGELARALHSCHLEEWRQKAEQERAPTPSQAPLPSKQSSMVVKTPSARRHGYVASTYRRSINDWFQREVSPILWEKRRLAVRVPRRQSL